jgi:hypothetical protein
MSKLSKVRALLGRPNYHPSFDFYKKIREEIIDTLRFGKKKKELLDFLSDISDGKKKSRYRNLVDGLLKFLGRKKIGWFDPPSATWSYKDLRIKMNPELGLEINGEKYITKLYFKDTPLQKKDIKVLLWMMHQTLCQGIFSGYKCALLDVEHGKIFPFVTDEPAIRALLEGEADYFIKLWHELEKKSA